MALPESLQKFSVDELCKLVRIPSISFPGFDPKEVQKSAEATASLLKKVGFQNVELISIDRCHPYVVGDFIHDPKLPTALLYAHHDVQPPGREDVWKTPPFEAVEKDGRLYGRGTADDKAGVLVHAAALEAFTNPAYVNFVGSNHGKPPINLKVIIEGEEEYGSTHLREFLKQNQKKLQSDLIIVTDTGNIDSGVPSLTIGLRGLVFLEIMVSSLKAPLHSGMWGGAVVDPVQVLVKMLSKLTDDDGTIQLKSIGKSKPRDIGGIEISQQSFGNQAGVLKSESVPTDFLQKIWFEPSYSINAIQASSEKLANNIICDRAYARLGIRLTKAEKAEDVQRELVAKLKSLAPSTVELEIREGDPADAWETDPHSKENKWAFDAATAALEKAYQHKVHRIGCGASIPFIKPFEEALKAPVITFGVEDPYTLAHSENESLLLSDFYKTIHAEIEMWKMLVLAKTSKA